MAKDLCFLISNGVDGYLPDNVDFYRCENAVDAFDAICDAIRHFKEFGISDFDESAEFKESDWCGFFEGGCSYPDASQWSFTLAQQGAEILSLQGLTAAEYEAQEGN
jgi:hypothetical protein